MANEIKTPEFTIALPRMRMAKFVPAMQRLVWHVSTALVVFLILLLLLFIMVFDDGAAFFLFFCCHLTFTDLSKVLN